ncbi:MAG: hypothetical protein ACKO3P_01475 [Planctomycetaceae bacterium]
MSGLRLWLGGLGMVLGWAMVADAGSMITLCDSTAPYPSALTRDGQAFAGGRIGGYGYAGRYRNGTNTTIEDPTGPYVDAVTGISNDGNVVTGDLYRDDACAYRWENGVLEPLLGPGDAWSYTGLGNSVSADGSIVVGAAGGGGTSGPAFWQGGVRTFLPTPVGTIGGYADSISADGRTIVGGVAGPNGNQAVVWRDGVLSILPDLPGGSDYPTASNVSSDGSVIVGAVDSASGYSIARWVNGDLEVLKRLPSGGGFAPSGHELSDDGSIVLFTPGLMSEVWREGIGSKTFDLYAERHFGFSLASVIPDFMAVYVGEMTPDGNTFSGVLYDSNYSARSFILYLDPADYVVPEPSSLALAGCAAVGLLWAGRRSRAGRN